MNEDEILRLLRQPQTTLAKEVYALRRYLGECQKHLHESIRLRNRVIGDQKEIILFQHLIIANLEKQLEQHAKLQTKKNSHRRHSIRLRVRGKGL
jgi:hypothetical protein